LVKLIDSRLRANLIQHPVNCHQSAHHCGVSPDVLIESTGDLFLIYPAGRLARLNCLPS